MRAGALCPHCKGMLALTVQVQKACRCLCAFTQALLDSSRLDVLDALVQSLVAISPAESMIAPGKPYIEALAQHLLSASATRCSACESARLICPGLAAARHSAYACAVLCNAVMLSDNRAANMLLPRFVQALQNDLLVRTNCLPIQLRAQQPGAQRLLAGPMNRVLDDETRVCMISGVFDAINTHLDITSSSTAILDCTWQGEHPLHVFPQLEELQRIVTAM